MHTAGVLLDILVVLLAAKAAAEVAERIGVPAVVGEILAGVVVGPSVMGLVAGGEVLEVLGELGVILLLLEVGMEMDLAALGAVGPASLRVAVAGVALPMVGGVVAGTLLGMTGDEALFVGAALTATSVGITARVFGDLRALASVEARTVLGAAVADDVLGLVILTVVVRVVTEGSVSAASVAGIVGVAVGFLVVATVVGIRLAPGAFDRLARGARSSGTLVVVAFAFTLGVAHLAAEAKLAPIIGAFVAGIALGRSPVAERVRRELTPVAHLLVPVFFLQIGVHAEVERFADPGVLGIAGVLLIVGAVGKLAAAAGLLGAPGDRLLVGIGMVPRGEVGLIFAAIGLQNDVFDQDVYAALLLVVLVTTLVTPPALRWRLAALRTVRADGPRPQGRPDGGWLHVVGGRIELRAEPGPDDVLAVALQAASLGDDHAPGESLLTWIAGLPDTPLRWGDDARAAFDALLRGGGARAWRFVALSGILERSLPELAEVLHRRQRDVAELDPLRATHQPMLHVVHDMLLARDVLHPERALLAALVLDLADDGAAVRLARRLTERLGAGAEAEAATGALVADAPLVLAAARRPDALAEERVLQLAAHLGSVEHTRATAVLAMAMCSGDALDVARVEALGELVVDAMQLHALTGRTARDLDDERRREAARLVDDPHVVERIDAAPRAYVLAVQPAELARHARLCEPPMGRGSVRAEIYDLGGGVWRVDVASTDRRGLLATEARALGDLGCTIRDAVVATWGDGGTIASFTVGARQRPDPDRLAALVRAQRGAPPAPPVDGVELAFDGDASPWHTLCHVTGPDRPGVLAAVTAAFAHADVDVHAARIGGGDGRVSDHFELTDRNGRKLDDGAQRRIADGLRTGTGSRRARRRGNGSVRNASGDRDVAATQRNQAETVR